MMKEKKGFTLAEVLVALAIAGVIAALVIPQLAKNINKSKTAATLARAVEQVETAAMNYIEEENAKLTDGSAYTQLSQIPNVNIKKLASYMNMSENTDVSVADDTYNYISYSSLFVPATFAAQNTAITDFAERVQTRPQAGIGGGSYSGGDYWNGPVTPDLPPVGKLPVVVTPKPIYNPDYGWGGSVSGSDTGSDSNTDNTTTDTNTDNNTTDNNTSDNTTTDNNTTDNNTTDNTEGTTENKPAQTIYSSKSSGVDVIFTGPIVPSLLPNAPVVAVIIDTSGINKKPNIYGKDAFVFSLSNSGKMVPYGQDTYKTDCANGSIKNSMACSARVVADGYKIKY
ncbi:MAG: type II secretion system protein [Cyanobacteria bacterium SIG31]|nr:type II secretion system protein [Cyanobacteria bacterium SIG31]